MTNKMKTLSNLLLLISFSFFGITIVQSDFLEDESSADSQCWICDAKGCTNAGPSHTGVTECEDVPTSNPPCSFDGKECDGTGLEVD